MLHLLQIFTPIAYEDMVSEVCNWFEKLVYTCNSSYEMPLLFLLKAMIRNDLFESSNIDTLFDKLLDNYFILSSLSIFDFVILFIIYTRGK